MLDLLIHSVILLYFQASIQWSALAGRIMFCCFSIVHHSQYLTAFMAISKEFVN